MTTYQIPGLILKDHRFLVPLDHQSPDGPKITVFAREVSTPGNQDTNLPWLVFLQGGPGFGAPRPETSSGWIHRALREYRLLLLDQRGTGLSTPILAHTAHQFTSPQEMADYLKFFRADAIVKDAEFIRKSLVGDEPWSLLGQSYGGFCAVHYLSSAPEGLREAIITGGLPPLTEHPDDIYRSTYRKVLEKNHRFFDRYPRDAELAKKIAAYLLANDIRLTNGDRLTARRFQQLGISFGASNGFEQVHYLMEHAFVQGADGNEISYTFLRGIENAFHFETNPIYALLHEPIYCQGTASNWSAQRVSGEFPQFQIHPEQPFFFTGEMIYPWMFDEYRQLRTFKETADILAEFAHWPDLYDVRALNANQVPCAAAMYYDDMYVARKLSEKTAKEIAGIRVWVTNEFEHSGLRLHGEKVLDRLLGMLHGEH